MILRRAQPSQKLRAEIEREIGVIAEFAQLEALDRTPGRSKSVPKNVREITLRFRLNQVMDVGRVTAIC